MVVTSEEKEIRSIIKKTTKNMEELRTYRPQFDPTIKAYAQMRQQYNSLTLEFYSKKFEITEEYENKNGSINIRKTAKYLAMETLRKDIMSHENVLGLTPAGLKKINDEMKSSKKNSLLSKALSEIG